jgi:hypothetical protein
MRTEYIVRGLFVLLSYILSLPHHPLEFFHPSFLQVILPGKYIPAPCMFWEWHDGTQWVTMSQTVSQVRANVDDCSNLGHPKYCNDGFESCS